ncbi:hypothetical protein [Paludibaculum fermentans]|uniref:hypothetical protein n=1 Tax=Paludibaculum fermentans TaxID=1473598 RepID=UPI003EC04AE8
MAIRQILSAHNEQSSSDAYHLLLNAIGNDHAGTYYSIALGILPSMERILREGSPWSQRTILEVLIELYGSFEPEPGQERYLGVSLKKLIEQGISVLAPLVGTLEKDGGVAATSARQLLELMDTLSQ